MSAQFTIVDPEGDIHIPTEVQKTLGFRTGSRLLITANDGKLIAERVEVEPIEALRDYAKAGGDMVAELQQERRAEDRHSRRKYEGVYGKPVGTDPLDALYGILKSDSGEDLVEELQRERRQDKW